MGTKNNPGRYDCYNKADPDEPIFTLRANDPIAPILVRLWVAMSQRPELMNSLQVDMNHYPTDDKDQEAWRCAASMEIWYAEHR